MTFLEKLDWLIERDGLNKHSLAQKSGIPYTTIVGLYERGFDNVRLSTVQKLCVFFNVPLDYLAIDAYDKPEDFVANGRTVFTVCENDDECDLIKNYRSLNASGKSAALTTLRAFASNPVMKKETYSQTVI